MSSAWRCGLPVLLAALPVAAQGAATPDEFAHLEVVLAAALQKAAPFTVTVETFGGTRQLQGREGPMDGEAQPRARPAPRAKPPQPTPPAPDGKPAPEPAPAKKPLVAGGFQQTGGRTTGVVLSSDGWILVSRFALALEPTTILITVPGRGTFHAERAGEDTSRGIALVKIDASDLPTPEFVDPATVQVGQWALALGRTFASDLPTVHFGIVSARQRLFGRALQIDAYTSPANYGGPVIDVHGRVLGIAVPLSPSGRNAGVEWYDSGIGFATTIHGRDDLLERLRRGEVLQRGWLGVQFAPDHLGPGAKLAAVTTDGPAARASEPLAKGDVLLAVDGVAVRNGPHGLSLLGAHLGGAKVRLQVRRGDVDLPEQVVELADAPWLEQRPQSEELPASFEVPERK